MLDGALACIGGFRGANLVRQMSGKGNVLLAGLVREREVSVAGNAIVDFDEVGAAFLDFVNHASGVVRLVHDNGARPDGRIAVDDDAADQDVGRERRSSQLGAQIFGIFCTKHKAHTGDAVGDVERKVFEVLNVDVHVPEAGDEVSAVGVDGAALRWSVVGLECGHGNNMITLENYSLIARFFAVVDVHDGDVNDSGYI